MQVQANILSYDCVIERIKSIYPEQRVPVTVFKIWLEETKILPVFQVKHVVAKWVKRSSQFGASWPDHLCYWRSATFFGWATDSRLNKLFLSLDVNSVCLDRSQLLEILSPFKWRDMLYSDEAAEIVLTGTYFDLWYFVDGCQLADAQKEMIEWNRKCGHYAPPLTRISDQFKKAYTPITVHKSEVYFVVLDDVLPQQLHMEEAAPPKNTLGVKEHEQSDVIRVATHTKTPDRRLLSSCHMVIRTLSHMTNSNPTAVCKTYNPNDLSSCYQLIGQLLELSKIDITEEHCAATEIEAYATLKGIKIRRTQKIAGLIQEVKSIKNNG